MAKVYAIMSGKGGVGKTTSTVNLGTCFNHLGENVIIVDGNLTTPNLGIHLGAPVVPTTLNHVLKGKAKLEDAIYEHDSGTKIIPASLALNEAEKIDYKKLSDITKKLKKITSHVIIDGAAGLGEEARSVMAASDEVIIITNPELASVTDALKTIKLAEGMKKPIKGVIITRHYGDRLDMSLDNIKEMLESEILGIIPEDASVKESQIMKNALLYTHPNSKALKNYIEISRKILGKPGEELGWFGKLLRGIGL